MAMRCFKCGGTIPDYTLDIDRSNCKYHKKDYKFNIDNRIKEQISMRNED